MARDRGQNARHPRGYLQLFPGGSFCCPVVTALQADQVINEHAMSYQINRLDVRRIESVIKHPSDPGDVTQSQQR